MYFSPHSLFFSRLKKSQAFLFSIRVMSFKNFGGFFPSLYSLLLDFFEGNFSWNAELKSEHSITAEALPVLNMRISSYVLDMTVLFTHLSVPQVFSQQCDIVDACSVCDVLWSPTPFLKARCLSVPSLAIVIFLLKCWSWHLYLFNCVLFLQPVCQEHFEFFSGPATRSQLCQFGIVGKFNQCKLSFT